MVCMSSFLALLCARSTAIVVVAGRRCFVMLGVGSRKGGTSAVYLWWSVIVWDDSAGGAFVLVFCSLVLPRSKGVRCLCSPSEGFCASVYAAGFGIWPCDGSMPQSSPVRIVRRWNFPVGMFPSLAPPSF